MLWLTLWFTVILKIPALYVAYLIWWSVKDPPAAAAGGPSETLGGGGAEGPRRGPRAPAPGRNPRPHGSAHRGGRRPLPSPSGRARTR
ncbi:MAG TPA: hypothetical protein VK915_07760 [Gaiellaceae bacterium]|nr:hypothetical protein [Gaiellaceae bacterium]